MSGIELIIAIINAIRLLVEIIKIVKIFLDLNKSADNDLPDRDQR